MASFLNDPNMVLLLAFLIGFSLANMLSKNLISTILMVKVFKRGNILVCVSHNLEDYYKPGKLDAGVLEYVARKRDDNKKPKRILAIPQDILDKAIFKTFNLQAIMVDDVKDSIFIRKNGSYESVGGYNSEAMAEKIDTALKKPPEDELGWMPPKTFQMITVFGILGLGLGLYLLYTFLKKHDANTKMIYDVVYPMSQTLANCTMIR